MSASRDGEIPEADEDQGRFIEKCLDCGRGHHELEVLGECFGAIDSQSTLYCHKCLEPIPHSTPAQILMGKGDHVCETKKSS